MAQPLVIAYHLVWTAYGWWLPNDPRGSGSRTLRNDLFAELGELHFGRKKLQPSGRVVRAYYHAAADLLKHSLLTFDEPARRAIAEGFSQVIAAQNYTCYACAIMPDHVHLVVRKHKHVAEEMAELLMKVSRERLIESGRRARTHPTWIAGPGWSVFLDHPDEVRRTIRYVEQNPIKDRLPAQKFDFVKPYDGWPFHPGHNPNSPYARRLRDLGRYPI